MNALVNEYYRLFRQGVAEGTLTYEVPPEMLNKLRSDTFIFSNLKANASLAEVEDTLIRMSKALTDADGNVVPFSAFKKEADKTGNIYI